MSHTRDPFSTTIDCLCADYPKWEECQVCAGHTLLDGPRGDSWEVPYNKSRHLVSTYVHTVHTYTHSPVLTDEFLWLKLFPLYSTNFPPPPPPNSSLPLTIRSVGCTVVEMLTCHPPLYDLEPMAAMFRIATQAQMVPPDLPPHCSEHAENFLSKCFVK